MNVLSWHPERPQRGLGSALRFTVYDQIRPRAVRTLQRRRGNGQTHGRVQRPLECGACVRACVQLHLCVLLTFRGGQPRKPGREYISHTGYYFYRVRPGQCVALRGPPHETVISTTGWETYF